MIWRSLLAAVLLALTPATAHAFRVCSMSASGVAFGVYSGESTSSAGSITIICLGSGNANYTLSLSAGNSGSYVQRQMTNGNQVLSYNLYKDPGVTLVFGDGTGGSTPFIGFASGPEAAIVPVYGRIPVHGIPAVGAYSDTIVATLRCLDFSCNTTTTSFLVTSSVLAQCTIAATNLVFGDYTQAQLDGKSGITLLCSTGTVWNVGLNAGNFPGATVTTRRMSGPGNSSLLYSLYQDGAHTINWGNTVGSDTVSGISLGGEEFLSVFGRVPAGQLVGPGGYVDTIIAVVMF